MRHLKLLILSPVVLLTACGGGGGGTGNVAVVSPAPVPTPSPTAMSVASPFDLSRSLLFQPFFSELRVVRRYGQNTPPFYLYESGSVAVGDDQGGTILSWDPAGGEYGVRRGAALTLYTRVDRTPDQPANGTQYLNYARSLPTRAGLSDYNGTGTASLNGTAAGYLVTGRETETSSYFDGPGAKVALEVTRDFVGGLATQPAAVPTIGSARWQGRMTAGLVVDNGSTTLGWNGTLDVDFGSRTVRGTIVADQRSYPTGTQPLVVSFTLDATVDPATGRIAGPLRSTDGRFNGRVLGRLFGPQATELGLVIDMTWDGGRQPVGGTIVAAR